MVAHEAYSHHNENIKICKDISHHVELKADRIMANQTAQALLTEANLQDQWV